MGSVTKSWTAVMVLQAVERGRVSLDDPAFVYIDPVMQRLWRSSMRKLWGAEVEKVKAPCKRTCEDLELKRVKTR